MTSRGEQARVGRSLIWQAAEFSAGLTINEPDKRQRKYVVRLLLAKTRPVRVELAEFSEQKPTQEARGIYR